MNTVDEWFPLCTLLLAQKQTRFSLTELLSCLRSGKLRSTSSLKAPLFSSISPRNKNLSDSAHSTDRKIEGEQGSWPSFQIRLKQGQDTIWFLDCFLLNSLDKGGWGAGKIDHWQQGCSSSLTFLIGKYTPSFSWPVSLALSTSKKVHFREGK